MLDYLIYSLLFVNFWLTLFVFRNNKVFLYRRNLIEQMGIAASKDAERNLPWKWRFQRYHAVSYEKMVLQFWRKLDKFYPDKSFVQTKK